MVPGVMGHTNFNMLLSYLPPLVITLALNMEPALGSLAGWVVGVAGVPGPWTLLGGAAMLVATFVVSVAAARREAADERAAGWVRNAEFRLSGRSPRGGVSVVGTRAPSVM